MRNFEACFPASYTTIAAGPSILITILITQRPIDISDERLRKERLEINQGKPADGTRNSGISRTVTILLIRTVTTQRRSTESRIYRDTRSINVIAFNGLDSLRDRAINTDAGNRVAAGDRKKKKKRKKIATTFYDVPVTTAVHFDAFATKDRRSASKNRNDRRGSLPERRARSGGIKATSSSYPVQNIPRFVFRDR